MKNFKYFFLFLLISFLVSCKSKKEASAVKTVNPPNVILIIGDDHGYADLGISGLSNDVKTPNIDRLAKEGTRFTNACATAPICSPSRVGLMTGSYHQRQKLFWYGGNGISDPSIKTIAEILKEKGYATGYVGKFHYGGIDDDINARTFPLNHGFDQLFGSNGGRKHYLIHNDSLEKEFTERRKHLKEPNESLDMGGFWEQDKRKSVKGFSTEILGGKAVSYIKEQQEKKQPFFLTLSFNAVHNFSHQLPEEYLKEHSLKGLKDWIPEEESFQTWYKRGRFPNNPEGRALYLGQLHYLDKEVGNVLSHLDASGLRENTIVIYIGDNGGSTPIYANNTPYTGSKYTMYEGGIRVPLIVSWKGQYLENKINSTMVSAMDVLPTIADAVHTEIPSNINGVSLHDQLKGSDTTTVHKSLFWYGGDQAAVKSGKWKYRWANDDPKSMVRKITDYQCVEIELGEFLYDIENDPAEKVNLKDIHPEIFDALKAKLESWKLKMDIN